MDIDAAITHVVHETGAPVLTIITHTWTSRAVCQHVISLLGAKIPDRMILQRLMELQGEGKLTRIVTAPD